MYQIYKRFEQAVHKELWLDYNARHPRQARPADKLPKPQGTLKTQRAGKKDKITQQIQRNLQLSQKYQFHMNVLSRQDLPTHSKTNSNFIPKKESKVRPEPYHNIQVQPVKLTSQVNLLPPNINLPTAKKVVEQMPSQLPQSEVQRIFCPAGCGRYFQPSRLQKHSKICAKVFMAKRSQFDSSKHRFIDQMKEVKPSAPPPPSKLTWQEKSLALRAQLKQGKNQELSEEQKQALRQMQQNDTSECSICKRRFNKSVIEKHAKFCESKAKMRK